MEKINFKYKSPAFLKEKKSKMVDELLANNKIRQVIEELNVSMDEINNNLGLFIRLLESYEECSKCNKEECIYSKNGMIPYLIRDEFNDLVIKYTLCDIAKEKRLINLNYLYKDFDDMYDKMTVTNLDPTVISTSGDALKQNLFIITELIKLTSKDISKENNFIIFGRRGSGKTSICAALTNYYVKNNHKCAFIDMRKYMNNLLNKISFKDNEGYNELLNIANNVEVLVIDNLGDEKISDWSRNILADILSNRNRSDKMTVITTSHTYDDLISLYSSIKGDTNYKANKIKAEDLINQIRSLTRKSYSLRND